MSRRAFAVVTVACGIFSVCISVAFALLPEMAAASGCMPAGAIVQFELARDGEDLGRIFDADQSRCRPLVAAAMDAVNRLDLIAFIPSYTAFAIAGALFLSAGVARPLSIAAIAAAIGAAAADYVETAALLEITRNLDAPEALLTQSRAAAWTKFALLAVHGIFCAGLCLLARVRRPILGVLLLLPAVGVGAAALDHERLASVMSGGFAIAWLGVLIAAAKSFAPAKDASP